MATIYRCLICGEICPCAERFCSKECTEQGFHILVLNGYDHIPRKKRLHGFVYYCANCGEKIEDLRYTVYCSEKCRRKNTPVNKTTKQYDLVKSSTWPNRRCHDCGRPTFNYRCDPCIIKWRKKNHVYIDEAIYDDNITYNDDLDKAQNICILLS